MESKEWYTIRYRIQGRDGWFYHQQNQSSFKLWTRGHAERILKRYYSYNPTAEVHWVI